MLLNTRYSIIGNMELIMNNKKDKLNIFELLAPAGSFEIMKAVIAAGADAVYVGGDLFGARAYANNFSREELLEAIDYAHLHGKKLYLTVNTLLKNEEMGQLYDYLLPFYERGLDAVLVQDFGVLLFVRKYFPDLPIHTSTQMTVTGVAGARLMQSLGVERIVMAREMSLEEMKKIHEETGMELEAFVHGALCYCYSGQCLFSSLLGGRSGNRGRCAQPCRLAYEILDEKQEAYQKETFALSLKDMCGIEDLNKLRNAGVYSLKIEGRMKQVSYAAGVVSFYRKYIDMLLKADEKDTFSVDPKDIRDIMDLGNRCGFTDGYYSRHNGPDMVTFVKPSYEKANEELQKRIIKQYGNKDERIAVEGKVTLHLHTPATYEVSAGEIQICVTGMEVMPAQKKPLMEEEIKLRMGKTGDTPFYMSSITVDLDQQIFLPNGALNKLRREALSQLKEQFLHTYRRMNCVERPEPLVEKCATENQMPPRIVCLAENRKVIPAIIKKAFVSAVYLELAAYSNLQLMVELKEDVARIRAAEKEVFFAMPRIFRQHTAEQFEKMLEEIRGLSPDGFLVRTYEEIAWVKKNFPDSIMLTDHNLYTYNDWACDAFARQNVVRNTVPLELNRSEIIHRNNQSSEMIVYGYYPLMTSAQCVHKNTKGCDTTPTICYLRDRYKVKFAVKNYCSACYNVIYNSLPVMLFSHLQELQRTGIQNFRLDFILEDCKRTEEILDLLEAFMKNPNAEYPKKWQNAYTNGHYKRGVE